MEQEFLNNVFSFIVAFVASLFGVTSPLILDSINNIDKKYKCSILTTRFTQELVYKCYKRFLVPVVAIVFIIPFIIWQFDCGGICSIILLSVQCVLLLVQVLIMFNLFNVIQIYYEPLQLAARLFPEGKLESTQENRDKLKYAVELMRYACERSSADLYSQSRQFITKMAYAETPEHIEPLVECHYNTEIYEALRMVVKYAQTETLIPLSHDNIFAELVYPYFTKHYLEERKYEQIWYALYQMSQTDNHEWFRQFWVQANQYYSFVIESHPEIYIQTPQGNKIKRKFLEFHYMVGALLIQANKYECLKFMMNYDNCWPPHFYLIPGTFSKIFEMLIQLESYLEYPMTLTKKYQMIGMFHNIDSDQQIVLWGYRYAALLMIRLYEYSDYNINFEDPLALPVINSTNMTELDAQSKYVERLLSELKKFWYEGERCTLLEFSKMPNSGEVGALLIGLKEDIDNKIKGISKSPTLSIDKLRELKNKLVRKDNITPKVPVEATTYYIKKLFIVDYDLDIKQCTKEYDYSWSSFPEALLTVLKNQIDTFIDTLYLRNNNGVEFIISEKNVFKALEILNIPNGYMLLCKGVNIRYLDYIYNKQRKLKYDDGICSYGNLTIEQTDSRISTILIVKPSDKLMYEYIDVTNEDDIQFKEANMSKLDGSDNYLFSDIDSIINKYNDGDKINEKAIPSKLGRGVKVYLNDNFQFARIRVVSNISDSNVLAEMKQFKEYFGKQK